MHDALAPNLFSRLEVCDFTTVCNSILKNESLKRVLVAVASSIDTVCHVCGDMLFSIYYISLNETAAAFY